MFIASIKGVIAASSIILFSLTSQANAISANGFSLSIHEHQEDQNGYVRMGHGMQYAVCLFNDLPRRADALLSIDGLVMGNWRLAAYQRVCIERPVDDTGRLTFYRTATAEGVAVGESEISTENRGVVSVRFSPEQALAVSQAPSAAFNQSLSNDSSAERYLSQSDAAVKNLKPAERLHSGVTGLTGQSEQVFIRVDTIEYDEAAAITLELRLVHDDRVAPKDGPRPLPRMRDRLAPPPVGQ